MTENMIYLNKLWTEYLREVVKSEKLKILIHSNDEVADFLLSCEFSHAESYSQKFRDEHCSVIYLKRNEDVISFRKEFYANRPSKVEFNFEVVADKDELEKISDFLVEWFIEFKLYYYAEHFEALQNQEDCFMTFLNYAKCDVSTIQYSKIDEQNIFNLSVQSERYRVVHKQYIDSLARKEMLNRMYGIVFSDEFINLGVLANLSGIQESKIREMYHLEENETLDDDQADEFIEEHVDVDAYYRNEFKNYGYLGLLGNKKFPEVISGDFYIYRMR
ncbi:hypothetical protein [Bacillus thuringiensis]|uniref:Uncharacterized protein n=1 Tax=Bacillus thuringiensis TaxID=1428 RepID=A0A9X6WJ67_BACTU|nr:hypothetical protein [Bacillus thuringiensis]PFJ31860.1 hypothetical protein COJ15_29615 [Bacillus thuringiensis]